ncbi:Ku protein [Speluncibacter jeojiensis]|uniref:Non-homologous end joining protein Ku n=1 Tax=Speluncibacter jeojiensis TaxID=2710754 RepID=A0A9X4REP1_9ACTN|nr:Ku protein [Corynebacteriales bacterium D3-21]
MRSIWKGSLAFGLVNVPVKAYAATEDHDLKFGQVHAADHGKIRYRRVCEVCGETVQFTDIARAYTADDGRSVIITDDDLATLPEESAHEIEVLEFVAEDELDPITFDRSYFLEPSGPSPKAYALLRRTLEDTGRVAIVHFALRRKTRLATLRVRGDALLVQTLLWPDEVRTADFPVLDKDVTVKDAELAMAKTLVDSMSASFDPDRYHDTYQEELAELVEAKLEGGEAFGPATTEIGGGDADAEVIDLLAALEKSVRATTGDTGGRRGATR